VPAVVKLVVGALNLDSAEGSCLVPVPRLRYDT